MLFRRKLRSKLIVLAIIVVLFLYWHGIKNVAVAKGWNCNYQIVYAICDAKNNKAQLPGIWDILKAGAKF
jgi:hypothetical protein